MLCYQLRRGQSVSSKESCPSPLPTDSQMHLIRPSLPLLSLRRLTVERSLKEPTPLPLPIVLADATTLKLTFTVVETTSGDGIFPQQAHLLFEDPKGGNDVTLPINVKANGKASFTLVRSLIPYPPRLAHPEHGQTSFGPNADPRPTPVDPARLLPRFPHTPRLSSRRNQPPRIHPHPTTTRPT